MVKAEMLEEEGKAEQKLEAEEADDREDLEAQHEDIEMEEKELKLQRKKAEVKRKLREIEKKEKRKTSS